MKPPEPPWDALATFCILYMIDYRHWNDSYGKENLNRMNDRWQSIKQIVEDHKKEVSRIELEELKQKMSDYFDSKTEEELKEDLKRFGFEFDEEEEQSLLPPEIEECLIQEQDERLAAYYDKEKH